MTRRAAVRVVACVTVLVATIRCTERPITGPAKLDNSIGVILSGLVSLPRGSAVRAGSATSSAEVGLVYVSLSPGAVPDGIGNDHESHEWQGCRHRPRERRV